MFRKTGLKGNTIHKLLATYIVIWIISPPMQYGAIYRLSVLACAMFWFLLMMAYSSFVISRAHAAVVLFTITATLVLVFSGYDLYTALTHNLQLIMILLCVCIFLFYFQKEEYTFLIFIAKVTTFFFFIWSAITFAEYQVHPGVSRLLVRSSDYAITFAKRGVGGYGLVYSMCYVSSAMLYAFKKEANVFMKLLYASAFAFGALLVFESGYLIACLLLLASIFCFVIGLYNDTSIAKIVVILLFVLAVAMICAQALISYSNEIIKLFDGTLYKQKVVDIFQSLVADESTGKVSGRTDKYTASFISAIKYGIPGAYLLGKYDEVGEHSVLLDLFASYGLIGSLGFYYSFGSGLNTALTHFKNNGFIKIMVILLLANGVLNTYTGAFGVAVFIVIPGVILKYDNLVDT